MQWPWPSICLPHGMTSRSLTSSNKHTDQHASVALGPLRPVLLSRRPSLPPAGILLLASVCACSRPAMWPGSQGALRPAGRKDVWLCLLRFAPLLPVQTTPINHMACCSWQIKREILWSPRQILRPNRCHFGVGLLSQSSGQPSQLPQWSVISGVDKHSDRAQEKLGSSRS